MSADQRPTADDIRRAVADDGLEFFFAQFVDMHAKPSAKLVPAQKLDGLLTDGAGFAGFAAGDIGQTPDNPDLIAMPDVAPSMRSPSGSRWRRPAEPRPSISPRPTSTTS